MVKRCQCQQIEDMNSDWKTETSYDGDEDVEGEEEERRRTHSEVTGGCTFLSWKGTVNSKFGMLDSSHLDWHPPANFEGA
eukprot:994718-Rhodomonas_salina.1